MPEVGRRCACGCGVSIEERSERTRYFNGAHRQRAHRGRVAELATQLGLPASLSLRTVEAARSTRERNGDAQIGAPRSRRGPRQGVTVYLPTVAAARAALRALGGRGTRPNAPSRRSKADAEKALRAGIKRRASRPSKK